MTALAATANPNSFLPGLALALAAGLLLGVERGWRMRDEEAGSRVAGIRTFALLGLLGGLAGISIRHDLAVLGSVLLGGAIAALLLGYAFDMRRDNNVSATSALAAVLTLGLGAMATAVDMVLASVGAGAAVILLASRDALHGALRVADEKDIKALLRLVLVVFIILPLLPDRGMGPFGALNPYRLWTVVVVTGSISFIGYMLARWLGERRGALLVASVGALVSSTAVTVDGARKVREGASGIAPHASVAVASTIMLLRSLLLVSLIAPLALASFAALIWPGLAASAAASAILLYVAHAKGDVAGQASLKPPGLAIAFLFALTVAVLALASAWVQARWGGQSGAVLIAVGGMADIDAAIAAVGTLPPGMLTAEIAALTLAVPTLANTLFKLFLFLSIAGRRSYAGALTLGLTALVLLVPILLALPPM